MARLERVILGSRAQVFAAAYELVVMRGVVAVDVNLAKATFSFRTPPSVISDTKVVRVSVRPVDDTQSVVAVEAETVWRNTRQVFDWGSAKRYAGRLLDEIQRAWAEPLRAYAEPGWYGDPTGRNSLRYWDGNAWTPWAWFADSLRIDHPQARGWLVARWPVGTDGLDSTVQEYQQQWLAPPMYVAARLLGPRGLRRARNRRYAVLACSVGALIAFVGYHVAQATWAQDDTTTLAPSVQEIFDAGATNRTTRPIAPTSPPVVTTAPTLPTPSPTLAPSATATALEVGTASRQPGEASVAVLAVERTPGSAVVSVDVTVCAGSGGAASAPAFLLVQTTDHRVFTGAESTRTPSLPRRPLAPGECERGWVDVPVADGAPEVVLWRGGTWQSASWRV